MVARVPEVVGTPLSRAKCRARASASPWTKLTSYVGPCFPLPSVPQPSPEGLPPQPSPPVCVAEDQPGGLNLNFYDTTL